MAIRYTVTHYSFVEPKEISEQEYLFLKNKLQNDLNFTLIDTQDTITNRFGCLIKFSIGTLISLPIYIILLILDMNDLIDSDNLFLGLIMIITGLWGSLGLIFFLMKLTDLSTYAGYLKKKRSYFQKMEEEIRKSKNYDDFFYNFYQ
ncbi:MAG: hypothetical protein Q4A56_04485 [Porphyromonadaceae bacterium]|nr:hypothetical protein [Porphyromonadaceae bacterium]